MAISDDMMDEMVASQELVPRVDKYVGTKRAGMREGDLPVFKNDGDAEMFLEAAGIISPTAEVIRGVKQMTEGELLYGMGTIGFGMMGGGTIKAIKKGVTKGIRAAGNAFKSNPEVLADIIISPGRTKMNRPTYHEELVRANVGKEELSKRLKDAGKNFDEDHVEGLIRQQNKLDSIEDVGYGDDYVYKGIRTLRRPSEIAISKTTGEFRTAAFKLEEYIQRSKKPLAPFMEALKKRNAKGGTIQEAEDFRRAFLVEEALDKGVVTPREAAMYRGSAFPNYTGEIYMGKNFDAHPAIEGRIPGTKIVKEIQDEVRKSLHAEDLNINAAKVEITPKGVRPIGRDPFDYLAD
jgi:hypothetical protein